MALSGEALAPKEKLLCIERSMPHGHVEARLTFIRHLGVDKHIPYHHLG